MPIAEGPNVDEGTWRNAFYNFFVILLLIDLPSLCDNCCKLRKHFDAFNVASLIDINLDKFTPNLNIPQSLIINLLKAVNVQLVSVLPLTTCEIEYIPYLVKISVTIY